MEAAGIEQCRFVVSVNHYSTMLYNKTVFVVAAKSGSYLTPYLTPAPHLI
jgi:hypothetical protein